MEKGVLFQSQSLSLSLASPLALEQNKNGGVQATFTLHKGQSAHFLLESAKEHGHLPAAASSGTGNSQEGTFGACSFWLLGNLARAGHLDEARLLLEKVLSYSNHVGLYAEEISPTGEALGNFPQAFTHLALITACIALDEALNKHGQGMGSGCFASSC